MRHPCLFCLFTKDALLIAFQKNTNVCDKRTTLVSLVIHTFNGFTKSHLREKNIYLGCLGFYLIADWQTNVGTQDHLTERLSPEEELFSFINGVKNKHVYFQETQDRGLNRITFFVKDKRKK